MAYRLKLAASLAAVLLAAGLVYSVVRRDPKLGSEETAAALQQRLGTTYGFRCVPGEDVHDTVNGLDDVDYVCTAERATEAGYWVATDEKRITGIQSMG